MTLFEEINNSNFGDDGESKQLPEMKIVVSTAEINVMPGGYTCLPAAKACSG